MTTKLSARNTFLKEVSALWPLAKGSLCEVRKPCIRPQCPACAAGRKHRAFLFTYREAGRTRCLYVPADLVPILRQAVCNARELEQCLSKLGRKLVESHRQQRDQTNPKR
jgi:hypothetical protein